MPERLLGALATLSGICLLFMVGVVTLGVLSRYLLRAPILGVNEIVQMTAVVVITLALPHATRERAHVRVDLFDRALGRIGGMIGDLLARLLGGFILADLARRALAKARDALEFGDTTNMLALPLWPFHAALALGAGLTVVVFLGDMARILCKRSPL